MASSRKLVCRITIIFYAPILYSMKGMTGFSYIHKVTKYGKVNVSLKTLNSRFLEIKLVIHPFLQELELSIRKMLKDSFKRGKVELFIDFFPKGTEFKVEVDEELAKGYFLSLKKLSNYLGLLPDIEIVDIAKMPNVVNLVKLELPSSFFSQVRRIVKKAIDEVLSQRIEEGNETRENIVEILFKIRKSLDAIRARWGAVNLSIEEKVRERVERFFKDYRDRNELDVAVVAFLLKVDINEEIFRFSRHLEDLEKLVSSDSEIGKKIEFLVQELNREINTIASKSFDYEISSSVVEIKSALEKIREHAQNIE
ncbi:MAG: YicC/YloC family endoribonuclease [Brevinematia bacterium]